MSNPNKKYQIEDRIVEEGRLVSTNVLQYAVKPINEKDANIYVLVTRRGKDTTSETGKLCVPGGCLDWDETLDECASRELFEETGFENKSLQILGINSNVTNMNQTVIAIYGGVTELAVGEELPELIGNDESEPFWMIFDDVIKELNEIGPQPDKWAWEHDVLILETTKHFFNLGKKQEETV